MHTRHRHTKDRHLQYFLVTLLFALFCGTMFGDVITLTGTGNLTYSDYNDSGQLLLQTHVTNMDVFQDPLLTYVGTPQTSYTDTEVFRSAVSSNLQGVTVTPVNFLNASNLMTITNVGVIVGCDPQLTCGTQPPNPYPYTISSDGTTLTGEVGYCSGRPRCVVNGWEFTYYLDIHFTNPVYAIFGDTGGGVMTTKNPWPAFENTLLYAGNIGVPGSFGGYVSNSGWIFPQGISEIYVNTPFLSLNGTNDFTLSNFLITTGTPTPEPTTIASSSGGFLLLGWLVRRRRQQAA